MKIGVKTYDNEKFLDSFTEIADFFEVQAIQKNDYSFLKKYSIPIVIHAEHYDFGVNYADNSKRDFNMKSINFAIKLADLTNAKKIIVHPGNIEKTNSFCSKGNAINFLNEINDKRILIENLPVKENNPLVSSLCFSPEQIKEFVNLAGKGFCFDVNHALIGKIPGDYGFIRKFVKLNPGHYHIGGQKDNSLTDSHLPLNDSDLNLHKILNQYPKDAEITLETKPNIKDAEKDLEIIKEVVEGL